MAAAVAQTAVVVDSTANGVTSYTGASFTVGSGADRLLVLKISGYTDLATTTVGALSVSHNGQAMAKQVTSARSGRVYTEIWTLTNPTAGTGTTSITMNGAHRACGAVLEEYTGVDQTTSITTTVDAGAASLGTSRSVNITTTDDGAFISGALCCEGDVTPVTVTGGGTLAQSGATGTAGTSDCTYGAAYEEVATAGADGFTFNFGDDRNAACGIEIKPAAGGTTDGAGSSSGTSTASATGASTHASDGSAAGSATASATGASTVSAAGNASGSATASATGGSVQSGAGAASGGSTASATAEATASGAGTAAGTSAATGVAYQPPTLSAPASTPLKRTAYAPAENRVARVAAEHRTATVPRQARAA